MLISPGKKNLNSVAQPSNSMCRNVATIQNRKKQFQPSWLLLVINIVFLSSSSTKSNQNILVSADQLESRCGDCWCIDEIVDGGCPTDTTGISNSFSDDYSIYGSFIQTNPTIQLQSSDGNEDCFPFKDVVGGDLHNYPESNWPQCEIPSSSSDTTVCAYLYESSSTFATCQEGRNYELVTYNSVEEANAAGAVVTHKGGR